jgi:hypothetical protein
LNGALAELLFVFRPPADNLSKARWSWGCIAAVDSEGRTIWITDAHPDGKHYVVRADEKLTAFLELEAALHAHYPSSLGLPT